MKMIKYYLDPGATSAFMKITIEATKGLGQRDVKGDMKDCFLFDSCF